jgi:hypothetical protein
MLPLHTKWGTMANCALTYNKENCFDCQTEESCP